MEHASLQSLTFTLECLYFSDRVRTATNGVAKMFGIAIVNLLCGDIKTDQEEEEAEKKSPEEAEPFLNEVRF